MTEAAGHFDSDELEHATDEAIAACDGDPRTAVAALLAANAELEREVSRLSARVSTGYARGHVRAGAKR